jgi:hypothetical protein
MSSRGLLMYDVPPTWDMGEALTNLNRKKNTFLGGIQKCLVRVLILIYKVSN